MTDPLDALHAAQADDVTYASDHQLRAFLTSLDPDAVRLDRAAHASPVEVRMIGRQQ